MADERAGRLHPTLARARNLVEPHLRGSSAVLAVSGGADSLALAVSASHFLRHGAELEAVVVDHGLQDGSAEVADRAAVQCRELGLNTRIVTVAVGRAGGIESAARTARYQALREAARSRPILLAHTLDDQAETVLMGIGRGSGARSLRGMAAIDGDLIRPFLGLRRVETEQICSLAGLSWWQDPHNADPKFRRVRVRREVLPLLEDVLAGGVAESLARTAQQLRDDDAALEQWAQTFGPDPVLSALAEAPVAVRRRVLRQTAVAAGANAGELTAGHLDELDRLTAPGNRPQRVELPGRVSARVMGDRLRFFETPVAG